MKAKAIAPVDKRIHVRLTPAEAFELFTREIGSWWPLATHSCSGQASATVVFEGGAGGAVIETTRDGMRHVWGSLLEWNPPHAFAMTWHPGQPSEQATRVVVQFAAAAAGGTEVRLLHSGWEARGDRAIDARNSYDGGWQVVLAKYTERAREAA